MGLRLEPVHDLRIPRSPRMGDRRSTHSATLTGHHNERALSKADACPDMSLAVARLESPNKQHSTIFKYIVGHYMLYILVFSKYTHVKICLVSAVSPCD